MALSLVVVTGAVLAVVGYPLHDNKHIAMAYAKVHLVVGIVWYTLCILADIDH